MRSAFPNAGAEVGIVPCSDDEEAQLGFMSSKGPSNDVGTPVHRVVKEVKRNWWLWGAVCFALVLITGVVMFRHKLYNTGNIGLPFLAGEKQEQLAAVARASFYTWSGFGI